MNATSETTLYVGLAHSAGRQAAEAAVPVGVLKIAQRGNVASGQLEPVIDRALDMLLFLP